jgi:carbon starvation protein
MARVTSRLGWCTLSVAGAFTLGTVALHRGEPISAIWIVVAAVCVYLIAYRFYSLFIARHVPPLDSRRLNPAYKFNDGLDYVPTNRHVLLAGIALILATCLLFKMKRARYTWARCC